MFAKQSSVSTIANTAWSSQEELLDVYDAIYSFNSPFKQQKALRAIGIWRNRSPKLSLSVECTCALVTLHLSQLPIYLQNSHDLKKDGENVNLSLSPSIQTHGNYVNPNSSNSLLGHLSDIPSYSPLSLPPTEEMQWRLGYSIVLLRFVNGIVDVQQKNKTALSVSRLAESLGIPRLFVDIRHESTHNELPSLALLRLAAGKALQWLRVNFWDVQVNMVNTFSNGVHGAVYEYRSLMRSMMNHSEVSLNHLTESGWVKHMRSKPKKRRKLSSSSSSSLSQPASSSGDTIGDNSVDTIADVADNIVDNDLNVMDDSVDVTNGSVDVTNDAEERVNSALLDFDKSDGISNVVEKTSLGGDVLVKMTISKEITPDRGDTCTQVSLNRVDGGIDDEDIHPSGDLKSHDCSRVTTNKECLNVVSDKCVSLRDQCDKVVNGSVDSESGMPAHSKYVPDIPFSTFLFPNDNVSVTVPFTAHTNHSHPSSFLSLTSSSASNPLTDTPLQNQTPLPPNFQLVAADMTNDVQMSLQVRDMGDYGTYTQHVIAKNIVDMLQQNSLFKHSLPSCSPQSSYIHTYKYTSLHLTHPSSESDRILEAVDTKSDSFHHSNLDNLDNQGNVYVVRQSAPLTYIKGEEHHYSHISLSRYHELVTDYQAHLNQCIDAVQAIAEITSKLIPTPSQPSMKSKKKNKSLILNPKLCSLNVDIPDKFNIQTDAHLTSGFQLDKKQTSLLSTRDSLQHKTFDYFENNKGFMFDHIVEINQYTDPQYKSSKRKKHSHLESRSDGSRRNQSKTKTSIPIHEMSFNRNFFHLFSSNDEVNDPEDNEPERHLSRMDSGDSGLKVVKSDIHARFLASNDLNSVISSVHRVTPELPPHEMSEYLDAIEDPDSDSDGDQTQLVLSLSDKCVVLLQQFISFVGKYSENALRVGSTCKTLWTIQLTNIAFCFTITRNYLRTLYSHHRDLILSRHSPTSSSQPPPSLVPFPSLLSLLNTQASHTVNCSLISRLELSNTTSPPPSPSALADLIHNLNRSVHTYTSTIFNRHYSHRAYGDTVLFQYLLSLHEGNSKYHPQLTPKTTTVRPTVYPKLPHPLLPFSSRLCQPSSVLSTSGGQKFSLSLPQILDIWPQRLIENMVDLAYNLTHINKTPSSPTCLLPPVASMEKTLHILLPPVLVSKKHMLKLPTNSRSIPITPVTITKVLARQVGIWMPLLRYFSHHFPGFQASMIWCLLHQLVKLQEQWIPAFSYETGLFFDTSGKSIYESVGSLFRVQDCSSYESLYNNSSSLSMNKYSSIAYSESPSFSIPQQRGVRLFSLDRSDYPDYRSNTLNLNVVSSTELPWLPAEVRWLAAVITEWICILAPPLVVDGDQNSQFYIKKEQLSNTCSDSVIKAKYNDPSPHHLSPLPCESITNLMSTPFISIAHMKPLVQLATLNTLSVFVQNDESSKYNSPYTSIPYMDWLQALLFLNNERGPMVNLLYNRLPVLKSASQEFDLVICSDHSDNQWKRANIWSPCAIGALPGGRFPLFSSTKPSLFFDNDDVINMSIHSSNDNMILESIMGSDQYLLYNRELDLLRRSNFITRTSNLNYNNIPDTLTFQTSEVSFISTFLKVKNTKRKLDS